jgi:hypothetical protein
MACSIGLYQDYGQWKIDVDLLFAASLISLVLCFPLHFLTSDEDFAKSKRRVMWRMFAGTIHPPSITTLTLYQSEFNSPRSVSFLRHSSTVLPRTPMANVPLLETPIVKFFASVSALLLSSCNPPPLPRNIPRHMLIVLFLAAFKEPDCTTLPLG